MCNIPALETLWYFDRPHFQIKFPAKSKNSTITNAKMMNSIGSITFSDFEDGLSSFFLGIFGLLFLLLLVTAIVFVGVAVVVVVVFVVVVFVVGTVFVLFLLTTVEVMAVEILLVMEM